MADNRHKKAKRVKNSSTHTQKRRGKKGIYSHKLPMIAGREKHHSNCEGPDRTG